jgi:hypothetical protein
MGGKAVHLIDDLCDAIIREIEDWDEGEQMNLLRTISADRSVRWQPRAADGQLIDVTCQVTYFGRARLRAMLLREIGNGEQGASVEDA